MGRIKEEKEGRKKGKRRTKKQIVLMKEGVPVQIEPEAPTNVLEPRRKERGKAKRRERHTITERDCSRANVTTTFLNQGDQEAKRGGRE